jgi:hypothetical protein
VHYVMTIVMVGWSIVLYKANMRHSNSAKRVRKILVSACAALRYAGFALKMGGASPISQPLPQVKAYPLSLKSTGVTL